MSVNDMDLEETVEAQSARAKGLDTLRALLARSSRDRKILQRIFSEYRLDAANGYGERFIEGIEESTVASVKWIVSNL